MYWALLPGAEGCKRPREISFDQNRTNFIGRNFTSAVPALMTRHLEVGYPDFLQRDPDCVRACRAVLARHLLTQARAAIERKRKAELMSPELRAVRELLVDTGLTVLLRRDFDRLQTWPAPLHAPGPLVLTGVNAAELHVRIPAVSAEQTHFITRLLCPPARPDDARIASRARVRVRLDRLCLLKAIQRRHQSTHLGKRQHAAFAECLAEPLTRARSR